MLSENQDTEVSVLHYFSCKIYVHPHRKARGKHQKRSLHYEFTCGFQVLLFPLPLFNNKI